MSAEAMLAQIAACRAFDSVESLGRIAVPTLVTCGRDDRLIPAALSRETSERIPTARLVEFATGHVHHWEELDVFNRTVLEWFDE